MSKPFRVAPFMKARRRKNPRVHQWVSGHAKCSIRVPVGCHPVITRSDAGTRATVCAQPCPTLCDPRDCDLPGSSAHGVLQARILEGVALPFSRASSPSRDRTHPLVPSALAGGVLSTKLPGGPCCGSESLQSLPLNERSQAP